MKKEYNMGEKNKTYSLTSLKGADDSEYCTICCKEIGPNPIYDLKIYESFMIDSLAGICDECYNDFFIVGDNEIQKLN